LWIVNNLAKYFGYAINTKGYKVLDDKVGVLWGDGIDDKGINNILQTLKDNGWAASNCVFGMGGGLLQKMNRDTQHFAFKCSAQFRNGRWETVRKTPKNDGAFVKESK